MQEDPLCIVFHDDMIIEDASLSPVSLDFECTPSDKPSNVPSTTTKKQQDHHQKQKSTRLQHPFKTIRCMQSAYPKKGVLQKSSDVVVNSVMQCCNGSVEVDLLL